MEGKEFVNLFGHDINGKEARRTINAVFDDDKIDPDNQVILIREIEKKIELLIEEKNKKNIEIANNNELIQNLEKNKTETYSKDKQILESREFRLKYELRSLDEKIEEEKEKEARLIKTN